MGDMADDTTDACPCGATVISTGGDPCVFCGGFIGEDDEDLEAACLDCYGSGQCQECDGGTDDDGNVCGECGGDGACQACDGTGEGDDAP